MIEKLYPEEIRDEFLEAVRAVVRKPTVAQQRQINRRKNVLRPMTTGSPSSPVFEKAHPVRRKGKVYIEQAHERKRPPAKAKVAAPKKSSIHPAGTEAQIGQIFSPNNPNGKNKAWITPDGTVWQLEEDSHHVDSLQPYGGVFLNKTPDALWHNAAVASEVRRLGLVRLWAPRSGAGLNLNVEIYGTPTDAQLAVLKDAAYWTRGHFIWEVNTPGGRATMGGWIAEYTGSSYDSMFNWIISSRPPSQKEARASAIKLIELHAEMLKEIKAYGTSEGVRKGNLKRGKNPWGPEDPTGTVVHSVKEFMKRERWPDLKTSLKYNPVPPKGGYVGGWITPDGRLVSIQTSHLDSLNLPTTTNFVRNWPNILARRMLVRVAAWPKMVLEIEYHHTLTPEQARRIREFRRALPEYRFNES